MITAVDEPIAKIRTQCWDKSFHAFGSIQIFNFRARKYAAYLNLLKVFGVMVPVTIGAFAAAYGLKWEHMELLIQITIPISILQLLVVCLSIIYKWDDELSYSFEAARDYNFLSEEFRNLADIPSLALTELNARYEKLQIKLNAREEQDSKHNVKEWENRRGMRFALRQNRRECVGCKITPLSIESTDCDVCGKYTNLTTLIFRV